MKIGNYNIKFIDSNETVTLTEDHLLLGIVAGIALISTGVLYTSLPHSSIDSYKCFLNGTVAWLPKGG